MKEFEKKGSPSREGFSKFLPASMSDSGTRRRLTEYEIQVQDLQAYVRSLEAETVHLRKKLEDSPKEFMVLENKLREANRQLVQAFNQNEKLVNALYEAREQISSLKEEVDKLCAPPSTYGVYLSVNEDATVNILSQGRKVKVNLHPSIKAETLKPGQELVLNEGLNVVEAAGYEIQGDVVILKEQLDDERAVVTLRADEEKVGIIADPLRKLRLKTGDHLLMDAKSGYLLEKLPKSEVEDLALEEVPDIGYDDIGGLGTQIEAIKDAVEPPHLYAHYYKEHQLTPPKGVLLYGPPGCGKTMIAKAVANNLAEKISEKRGEKIKGFFLNIKGPELLNKYVGETERKIREIFVKAKEKANEDVPVVVFFDEMDALFRTRGTGISSDVESTIVPQLLAEIDGVEGLKNVIVIGASNRQDLIDPAILRPGRLDVKIKVERPDEAGASDIFHKYLTTQIPIASGESIDSMIAETVKAMYALSEDNRFLEEAVVLGQGVHGLHRLGDHAVDRLAGGDRDLRGQVLVEDVAGAGLVGALHLDLHVQPARPQDGRVDQVLPVAGADHDDVLQPLHAVDLGQELRDDRGLDVGREARAARAEQGVHLVEEHHDRHVLVGLLLGLDEDLADLALGLTHVLVQQLGALDVQEVALDLLAALLGDLLGQVVGHGLGDHGLAAAGRAVEQHALRRRQLVLLVVVGVQVRQLDGVLDRVDLGTETADIVVADVRHFLERQVLDLVLRELLQQVAALAVHQEVVAGLQLQQAQGVAHDGHLVLVGAKRHEGPLRVELLLEDDDLALDLVAGGLDHVQALVQDQLLAGLEGLGLDSRVEVHLDLAALGQHVDRAVLVDRQVDAVGIGRRAELVDLLAEGGDLLACFLQGGGHPLLLAGGLNSPLAHGGQLLVR